MNNQISQFIDFDLIVVIVLELKNNQINLYLQAVVTHFSMLVHVQD